jgi:hypothetical protein
MLGGVLALNVVRGARAARAEIRAEAERTARFCEPDANSFTLTGV